MGDWMGRLLAWLEPWLAYWRELMAGGSLLALGAAAGQGGADKHIDVAATALHAGLTVDDLTRLDLEYAPPFNGVWDPLQVAATSLLRQGL